MSKAMQVKITLKDIKPPIWRRVLIKDSIILDDLHDIIQFSMGWENCHMYDFEFNGTRFMPAEYVDHGARSSNLKLSSLKLREKDKINYTYDFGDSWEHQIVIEKVSPIDKTQLYPFCIKAMRACPPEDSGGIPGYEYKIEAITNKSHPDRDDIIDWMGEDFDPEDVSLAEINRDLHSFFAKA
jgi:hypothetical protein